MTVTPDEDVRARLRTAVLGGGGWGTALAMVLAGRSHGVSLWCRDRELARALERSRVNENYLPGIRLSDSVEVTTDAERAVEGAEAVVVAVPVQFIRATLTPFAAFVPENAVRVGASKGIERSTLLRVSEVLGDIWGAGPYAVISGPSFAVEVARGEPTAVTVACSDIEVAKMLQHAMSSDRFRIYAGTDVVGVEVAGALKNVIAIAAGMARGLGFGANSLGGLLTRGLAEMTRLGVALGGRADTFVGLSGMGDLITTATGNLSRNVRAGEALAAGRSPIEGLGSANMVAEGLETALSAATLASRVGVEMPIVEQVVEVLARRRSPEAALYSLMSRELKEE